MKTVIAKLMLGGTLLIQPVALVWAGSFDGMTFSMQSQGGGHGGRQQHQQPQIREVRVAQPPPQAPREQPRGQLTQEERRQLHRDLDKANRELYSGGRRP